MKSLLPYVCKITNRDKLLSVSILIFSLVLVAGVVSASTTISTDITTGGVLTVSGTATSSVVGNLGVGTSTPWGSGLFTIGTSSPLFFVNQTNGYIGIGRTDPRAPFEFYSQGSGDGWGENNGAGVLVSGATVNLDGLMDFTAGAQGSCSAGGCASNGTIDNAVSGGWLKRGEANRWDNVPSGATYVVDIGASYPVKAITWGTYWKTSMVSQFTAYTIEYSTNGTDYTTLVNVTNNTQDPVFHYFGTPTSMRYVRITNTGASGAYVSNLQILGYVIQSPFSDQPWGFVVKDWAGSIYGGNQNAVFRGIGGVGIGTSTIPFRLTVDENKTKNNTNVLARFQLSSAGATSTAPQIYFGAKDSGNTMRSIAGVGGVITQLNTVAYQGALAFYTANNTTPAEVGRFTATGSFGIGTTTPTTQLQVTASASNATSTVTVGKVGQNKGSCLELFDSAGTAVYAYVAAGATTFTLSAVSCK